VCSDVYGPLKVNSLVMNFILLPLSMIVPKIMDLCLEDKRPGVEEVQRIPCFG